MRKPTLILLIALILFAGCSRTTVDSNSPQKIVESYIQATNHNDLATSSSLLADDAVIIQDPPGSRIEGKANIETSKKELISWNHLYTITTPIKVNDDVVTFSVNMTGDDLKIIGMERMKIEAEFQLRDDKIESISFTPDAGDWSKMVELTSGGIGIKWEVLDTGWKVSAFAENSPALAAGLKQGDIIVAVNKVNYSQMRTGEMELRIKGQPGRTVILTILRESIEGQMDIEVTRVEMSQLHY